MNVYPKSVHVSGTLCNYTWKVNLAAIFEAKLTIPLFGQTFELGIFISSAGMSILSDGKVWLQNIVKCGKYSPVKFANSVYFCIMRGKV